MATARSATGSVFGAVTSTFDTVTNVADAMSNSAGMLNDFVAEQRRIQKLQYIGRRSVEQSLIIDRLVKEAVDARIELNKSLGHDTPDTEKLASDYRKLIEAAYEEDAQSSE